MTDGQEERGVSENGVSSGTSNDAVNHSDDQRTDPRVQAALGRLTELDERPVTQHVAVFEDVHRRLHEALTALDES